METQSLAGGLWPVMLTPFHENNEVDYEGLKKITEFYIHSGANGLFANCLSSEMFQLSNKERLKIISTVVKIASRYKLSVVASGTFSHDAGVNADFIKQVYDAGVSGVIIITNQLVKIQEDENILKRHLGLLMEQTGDIPLGVYECPYPYKRLVSASLMKWLGETGRFFYHKDTSCDPVSIQKKIKAIKSTSLALYNANTATSLASLEMGARGLSPIGANFYPELYTFMLNEYYTNGHSSTLESLSHHLNIMDSVASKCYPYSAKLFLQFRNMGISTQCRIQYDNMHAEDFLNLKSLEKRYLSILYDFGIKQSVSH